MGTLLSNMDVLATAPGGVARLRELILTLAVQGKLVPQDPSDEPASELLKKIRAEKHRLIAEGKIKRDKPLAEISGEERPFGLPVGWEWVRLGETGLVGSSSRVHQSDWKGSGVPFYRAREIVKLSRDGHVPNELFISEELFASLTLGGWIPEPNDIMITGVGTIGIPYVVQPTDRFYFKDASVLIFKNFGRLDAQWLSLFMRSPLWVGEIHEYSMGTTVDTLTISRANIAILPLPPLAEQSRIVTRVEELMRLCDALEAKGQLEAAQHAQLVATLLGALTDSDTPAQLAENWQRVASHFDLLLDRPQAVDALEQTILQLAVRGLLVPQDPQDEPASELLKKIRSEKDKLIAQGKIKRDKPLPPIADDDQPFALPPGWEWVRLGEVVLISSGVTLGRKSAIPSPISLPYLRVANVQRWHLNLTSMKEVLVDRSELGRFQLLHGDLLITEGGDWDKVGRTTVWRDELPICLHQNHVFKARGTSPEWNPVWAEMYLNSAVARTYFASSAKQTTNLASINMTQLKGCVFPLPPLAEQSCIVTRVTQLRQLCAELRARLSTSQSTQAQLAEALVQSPTTV